MTADGETDTARPRHRESRSGTFRAWRRGRPCRDGLLMLPAILGGTLSLAGSPPGPRSKPGHGRGPGYRMLAAGGILPCALFCSPAAGPPAGGPGSSLLSPAAAGKGGVLPSALPSPAAAGNMPGQAAKHAAGGRPGQENAPVRQVQPPPGLVAPSAASVLTAGSSTLAKLNLVGVTTLPVRGGGSEKALKFTASSARLTKVGITIRQSGHTVLTTTASLDMPGGMTLYATKLCGQVEGIAPDVCFTPDTASRAALKLASALGQEVPVTMTNVTADQFLDIAPDARWGSLAMNAA